MISLMIITCMKLGQKLSKHLLYGGENSPTLPQNLLIYFHKHVSIYQINNACTLLTHNQQLFCSVNLLELAHLPSSTNDALADIMPLLATVASNTELSIQSFRKASWPHISGIQTRPATSTRCLFNLSRPLLLSS